MILSITFNPSVDRTLFVDQLHIRDTNRIQRTETDAGGKGVNVARVAKGLGAETLATGFLGGRTGLFVRSVLDEEEVPHDFVTIAGETRMNVSIESDEHGPPTTLNESGPSVSASELHSLFHRVEEYSQRAGFVTIGGSLPPNVPANAFVRTMQLAHGKRCVVDADGEPMRLALAAKPWMVKPNAQEAERLIGKAGTAAAKELHALGIAVAIVSMGAEGAAMSCEEGDYFAVPPKVDSISTIGSGDSLIGGFLFASEQNMSNEECLRWGVAAGAATAMTSAAEICRKPQVLELLPKVEVKRV